MVNIGKLLLFMILLVVLFLFFFVLVWLVINVVVVFLFDMLEFEFLLLEIREVLSLVWMCFYVVYVIVLFLILVGLFNFDIIFKVGWCICMLVVRCIWNLSIG